MRRSEYIFLVYFFKFILKSEDFFRQKLQLAFQRQVAIFSSEFRREFKIIFDSWPQALSLIQAEADKIEELQTRGYHFLLIEDSLYPELLKMSPNPPWVLSILGDPKILQNCSLSIVGAREPLAGSIQWLEENLAILLEGAPLCLASGGARGIDQVVHRSCLRYERPTVVFVPSGLSCLYPRGLEAWVDPIIKTRGALVSELHPRAQMRKWYFEQRNRLIAAISLGTFVVEARVRSGTWLTAQMAINSGRGLAALQGAAYEPKQSGNVRLISEGAVPIANAQDLVIFLRARCQEMIRINKHLVSNQQMGH